MVLKMKSFIRQIFKISDIFLKHKKEVLATSFDLMLNLLMQSLGSDLLESPDQHA